MIVLGIDSASSGLGVALAGPDGLIAETTLQVGLRHSQGLLPTVEWLLQRANVSVDELGAVAATIGPGSFTAVRIGLNTAKGLCAGLGVPLIGLSTLAVSAARFAGLLGDEPLPVAPWLDAKRQEVYAGYYDASGPYARALEPDAVIAPTDWLADHPGPALFVGDGARSYRGEILERLGERARFAPAHVLDAAPGVVACWGRERALRGETLDPADAAPLYLRRPQALERT